MEYIDAVYKNAIEKLATDRKTEVFYNSSDAHTSAVLTSMVRHSDRDLKIYCGSMCSEISNNGEYLDELRKFLKERNGEISVVLANYDSVNFAQSGIYKVFRDYPSRVKVKKVDDGVGVNIGGKPVHFTVADGRAFRVETDVKEVIAFGNFNDADSAKHLLSLFESLQESSSDIVK